MTVEYAVYPIGSKQKATTGRISVVVMPLPSTGMPNQAPVARSFSTSVTAGDPLTITVPSSGVDPDGDSVTVAGLVGADGGAVDLKFGRVTGFGPSTIKYEAYPTAAGTEVLNYEVRDRFGATSQGFVRIGVVQPGDPQPPVAVEDEVRAKPGKTVTVDATQNDLIARGDSIDLEYKAPLNPDKELAKWKVDEANTYFTTKVPAATTGVQHLTYGISNGLFDPSRSTISVVPDPNAKNPPVAVDDTAKPKQGETSTLVDALANDRDVDGTRESLTISSVLSPDATIENGQVRVQVKAFPYTVPYVIKDEDGLTAMALIYVPTGESGLPFVVAGSLIEMDKDSTKSVKLADYVKSPRARVVSITTADNVSASPRDRLRVEADGRSGLTLTSSGGYIGPGAVMLEVSDQETVGQKDFKTAYLSIPVQIGPKIPLLRCPELHRQAQRRRPGPHRRHPDALPRVAAGRHDPRRRRLREQLEARAQGRRAAQERGGRPHRRAPGRQPRPEQHQRPARGQGTGWTRVADRGVGVRHRRWRGGRQRQPAAEPGAAAVAAVLGVRPRGRLVPDHRPARLPRLAAGEPQLHDLGGCRPGRFRPARLAVGLRPDPHRRRQRPRAHLRRRLGRRRARAATPRVAAPSRSSASPMPRPRWPPRPTASAAVSPGCAGSRRPSTAAARSPDTSSWSRDPADARSAARRRRAPSPTSRTVSPTGSA